MFYRDYRFYGWEAAVMASRHWADLDFSARVFREGGRWTLRITGPRRVYGDWSPVDG